MKMQELYVAPIGQQYILGQLREDIAWEITPPGKRDAYKIKHAE